MLILIQNDMNENTCKMGIIENKYPDCFPENIEELIIADGAGENVYDYYRISKDGAINRDTFLSSLEESIVENRDIHNRDIQIEQVVDIDLGNYSTSGNELLSKIKRTLKCMKKYNDHPVIIVGKTEPSCGMSMRTKDSKSKRHAEKGHIDWWIYKDAHPEKFFVKYEEKDGGDENENS